MQRITKVMLEGAFKDYVHELNTAGVDTKGLKLAHGSKANGNPFRAISMDSASGDYTSAPGAEFGGFIGWTKREAYDTLRYMSRVLGDVRYSKM